MILLIGQVARDTVGREALPGARLPRDVRADRQVGRRRSTIPRGSPRSWRAPSRSPPPGARGRSCSRCPRTCSPRPSTCPTRRRTVPWPPRRPRRRDMERLRGLLSQARAPAGDRRRRAAGPRGRAPTSPPSPRPQAVPVAASFRCQDYVDNASPRLRRPRCAGHRPGAAPSACARPTCCSPSAGAWARSRRPATRSSRPGAPTQTLVHVHPDPGELGAVYPPELRHRRRARGLRGGGPCARAGGRRRPRRAARGRPRRVRAQPRRGARAARRAADDGRHGAPCASACRRTRSSPTARATSASGRTATTSSVATRRSSRRAAARWATACPAAVAAKAVHPDRPVVCVAGDGDFLMTGQELATAVQEELAVVVLVVNNGMYGTIRMHQERHYPGAGGRDRPAQPGLRRVRARLRRPRRAGRALRGLRAARSTRRSAAGARRSSSCASIPQAITPRQTLDEIRAASS